MMLKMSFIYNILTAPADIRRVIPPVRLTWYVHFYVLERKREFIMHWTILPAPEYICV